MGYSWLVLGPIKFVYFDNASNEIWDFHSPSPRQEGLLLPALPRGPEVAKSAPVNDVAL